MYTRPLLRDRCWESSEQAIHKLISPPDFETDNRPVSSKYHVQQLGLRTDWGHDTNLETTSLDSTGDGVAPARSRSRGREVRRNTRPAKRSRLRRKSSRTSLGLAFLQGFTGANKSSHDNRDAEFDPKLTDQEDYDLGIQQDENSTNLSGTEVMPLKHRSSKDFEADADCEVHVSNGIAVTEEAVDLGTPDIIMQV